MEFDNYMQHDAHEFFNFLINNINETIIGKTILKLYLLHELHFYHFAAENKQQKESTGSKSSRSNSASSTAKNVDHLAGCQIPDPMSFVPITDCTQVCHELPV